MLLGMIIMFMLMCFALGVIGWFAWRRLADHLKDNEEAVAELTTALTKHVFIPLLRKKKPEV